MVSQQIIVAIVAAANIPQNGYKLRFYYASNINLYFFVCGA
jgi:hypothetical protein